MRTRHLSLLPLPRHVIHGPTRPSDTLLTSPSLDAIERHLELQMKTTAGTQIRVPAARASSSPSLARKSLPVPPSALATPSPASTSPDGHWKLPKRKAAGTQIAFPPPVPPHPPPSLGNYSPFPHLHSPFPPLPRRHPTATGNCQKQGRSE